MATLEESAGLLMIRKKEGKLEFFLVHPGGPFWANKDLGCWGIPKGHIEPGEEKLATAIREFKEETSFDSYAPYHELGFVTYISKNRTSTKNVYAWAFIGDCDPQNIKSNMCEIDWPPHTGKKMMIPEIDRGAFFTFSEAREKIAPAQIPFLERAEKIFS